jgi:hypothetical protein
VQGAFVGNIVNITSDAELNIGWGSSSQHPDQPIHSSLEVLFYYGGSSNTLLVLLRCLTGALPSGNSDAANANIFLSSLRATQGTHRFRHRNEIETGDGEELVEVDIENDGGTSNVHEAYHHQTRWTRDAFDVWVKAHGDFSIHGKTLGEWLKVNIIFRIWLWIFSSTFATFLLAVLTFCSFVAFSCYSAILIFSHFDIWPEDLAAILLIAWWICLGPSGFVIVILLFRGSRDAANLMLSSVPHFERGLCDLVASSTRLLVSDIGFLGTTCSAAKIRDEICFLIGCSHPIILRKINDGDHQPQYQVVGTAEVHLSRDDRKHYSGDKFDPHIGYPACSVIEEYREKGILREFDLV